MHNLLTEAEVAERLRCSAAKVKRLRLSGALAFIRGRPVLVDEADLAAYIEGQRATAAERAGTQPGSAEYEAQRHEKARERARISWLQRSFAARARAQSGKK